MNMSPRKIAIVAVTCVTTMTASVTWSGLSTPPSGTVEGLGVALPAPSQADPQGVEAVPNQRGGVGNSISFLGYLYDSAADPITRERDITLKLYDAIPGGTRFHDEKIDKVQVRDARG
jgi:hypothetical protein